MKKTTSTLLSMALVFSSFGVLSAHAESLQKEKQFSPQLKANITQWGENKIAQNVETKTSKEISVIVELQHAPLASQSNIQHAPDLQNNNAQSYHAQLKKAQEDTTKKIKEKAPKATIKETYSTLFSGFSISIPGDQITALASLPEVKTIYPNLTYKLHETSKSPANQETPNIGGPTVGAPEAWNLKDPTGKPLDGKGMKVAIIDSGVDYTHPDLKANYIGGYDTVDEDNDPMDGNVHGTHVAGIIAGNGKIKGIAPNASILAYRVMNDGGTGTTEDIIQGIEHAIQDGADVLNLSLGQDLNVPDQPVTMTLERAAKLGVTAVVSNGNDGPKPWSVDAPGNASSVISVGASTVSIPFPTFQVAGSNKSFKWNGTKVGGSPLSDGLYQIEAVASNSGGETKQTGAVFVDRTAPKLTHEVDQENLIIRGKVTDILLDWMTESGWVAPGHPVTIQYEINGNGTWENAFLNHWEKNYEIYFDRSQLQQGKNTIHIVATDAAGNTSNLNVDLEVK
ncbi:S8 family serine peptidase [Bacillus toyonensis]|uniref:S8 family serine peptidase n=1 Tax=Bacillus toyonensis TaxID=155322 RepID=UPI002E1C441A|nr:S8 family serine peptidase [Bacillus toyonensis]MED3481155.1 S8 family serine peptidase [Bacillus toyonensis]